MMELDESGSDGMTSSKKRVTFPEIQTATSGDQTVPSKRVNMKSSHVTCSSVLESAQRSITSKESSSLDRTCCVVCSDVAGRDCDVTPLSRDVITLAADFDGRIVPPLPVDALRGPGLVVGGACVSETFGCDVVLPQCMVPYDWCSLVRMYSIMLARVVAPLLLVCCCRSGDG